MGDEDILQRLIDTEKASRDLLSQAQAEADSRLAEARRLADEGKRKALEASLRALEEGLEAAKAKARAEYEAELAAYASSLANRPIESEAFKICLEAIRRAESLPC